MNKHDLHDLPDESAKPPLRDVPKVRPCLRCGGEFHSAGFGDRICRHCKGSKTWRNGIATTYGASVHR